MEPSKLIIEILKDLFILITGYLLASFSAKKEQKLREQEHKDEMELLRNQLDEQKKQREFSERVYEDQKRPKAGLYKLNVNK